MFFFEKKNQKTFAPLRVVLAPALPHTGAESKFFLLLFFSKKRRLFP
jgi:hypothetical protein